MNIKKGDLVKIIKGNDRGKTGKIIKVFPDKKRVVIDGLNLVKKIKKAKKQGEKGELVSVPRPINRANVMLICPHCKQPTRVEYKKEDEKKYRFCKKCGAKIV